MTHWGISCSGAFLKCPLLLGHHEANSFSLSCPSCRMVLPHHRLKAVKDDLKSPMSQPTLTCPTSGGFGRYFVIDDGELHRCSRSFWRMKQGIIPKKLGEYVPLLDDSYTLEDKRKILLEMFARNSSTSCAHCVGLTNSAPRVLPAQQLDS